MSDSALRHRPIFGGIFGIGRYALGSLPCVMHGLHAVRFMVIEPATGAVLSLASDKGEAMNAARRALQSNERMALEQALAIGHDPRQSELWPLAAPLLRPVVDRRRPISKRRRDIFAKSGGCCHYCRAPLQLAGPWHIEHMLPRALGGADEIRNLVAACAPCNLAKSDRTAIEFVVMRHADYGVAAGPARGMAASATDGRRAEGA